MRELNTEGVCNLIAAVITLAKRDYYTACKNDQPLSEYNSKAALENFFYSDWLQFLSLGRANPERLMAQAMSKDY